MIVSPTIMSNEKSHKEISEEDDHPMQSKEIDSEEDEPREDPMASGECRKQKKARSAQVHNFTERIRRQRLKEKMKCLQELVPNCSGRDKASVLDDAIKYIKNLQYQLQMMSMAQGCTMSHVVACLMQSRGVQLPLFPHSTPWGGTDCEISSLASPPASSAAGPIPEFFSMPTPQAWELPPFPGFLGISGDVTIPRHDFLESLLPSNSSSLAPSLGTSFPRAGADQVAVTGDESSSFLSCQW